MDDAPASERDAGGERTVHLDVTSCFSLYRSPATPEHYARAAAAGRAGGPAPLVALADHGLHGAVRMARACRDHGVEHVPGLRARVVVERAFRLWNERPRELVLLAMDEEGWLNLVALTNLGHLAGSSPAGPRVDWRDLAAHAAGLLCLTGPPDAGLLAPHLDRLGDPDQPPAGALRLADGLAELFPGRLHCELVYHGHPLDKLANRHPVALARRLDLPLAATNAVRYATPDQAVADATLRAIGRGRRPGDAPSAPNPADPSVVAPDPAGAQAYLKSGAAMRRWFAALPEALAGAEDAARRCAFRLPLGDRPFAERYGPRVFLGADLPDPTARLRERAEAGLAARRAAEGRGAPPPAAIARLARELDLVAEQGLAEALLAAAGVADDCRARGVPVAARGSATASLVAWALGLVELDPLDHGLEPDAFVYPGRADPPDVDLEVALLHAEAVRDRLARTTAPPADGALPRAGALRLGTAVSLGARSAVREVGGALGLEPARVNALARLVPLLSSPGAIEEAVVRAPELGVGDLSPSAEPYRTVVQVAGVLEGIPRRFGAHPSALALDPPGGPGLLRWLPAQWVGDDADRPARRFPALVARPEPAPLAHPAAAPPAAGAELGDDAGDGDETPLDGAELPGSGDRPTLACQWTTDDLEALGLTKLDLSASASVGAESGGPEPDEEQLLAGYRLIAAGETLCVPHLETTGVRMLLKRAREAHADHGAGGMPLESVEDLAQLLALWRPGARGQEREEAYFASRYGGAEPVHPHPDMLLVLGSTYGQLLYADQLDELAWLAGCDRGWAGRHRRAVRRGELVPRVELEAALRGRARGRGWTDDQVDALLLLLGEHAGYLHHRGHALAQARHALHLAARKADPDAAPAFFRAVLNAGGSLRYGLGTAVEEARKRGVGVLPPCVNRSADRFVVEGDAVRVPLGAIRGLSPRAAGHVLAVRAAFGPYASLLDVCRRVDRRLVTRQDLLLLIKLGALGFTGLTRAQLTLAEQYYAAAGDLQRAADRRPADLGPVEEELAAGAARYLAAAEWPPEVLAAYDLAHLGFYAAAPLAIADHAEVLARYGAVPVAELADHPDRAAVATGAVVTTLRVRNTRKGERMAWLTLADGTGAIEAAVFPSAYPRAEAVLREGAFVVARGRVHHEEAGPRLFVDELHALGGAGARGSALAAAVGERRERRARTA